MVLDDQELDIGVNGLAVPVVQNDDLVATISLFGPTYRFNPEALPELANEVVKITESRLLGLLN